MIEPIKPIDWTDATWAGVDDDDMVNAKMRLMGRALDTVLLFHSAGPWDKSRRASWKRLTGADDATTKVLCDLVRAAVGEPAKEPA